MKKTAVIGLCIAACCMASGCESLGKKFVRKSKTPARPVEMVLEPQDYGGRAPSEEMYDQYFLYWKSWQDEFADALSGTSRKRQLDTASEALKNLSEMRKLLVEATAKKLDVYIAELETLKNEVGADVYQARSVSYAARAEKLRRQIMSDFSKSRIKGQLL